MHAGLQRKVKSSKDTSQQIGFDVTRHVVSITNTEHPKDDLDELIEEFRNDDSGFRELWDGNELNREVGYAIIEARNALQITQQQLADKIGIRQGDICKIERGNGNPSLKTLKRIAEGMGLRVTIAFELTPNAKSK